jgi:hypothetical protein
VQGEEEASANLEDLAAELAEEDEVLYKQRQRQLEQLHQQLLGVLRTYADAAPQRLSQQTLHLLQTRSDEEILAWLMMGQLDWLLDENQDILLPQRPSSYDPPPPDYEPDWPDDDAYCSPDDDCEASEEEEELEEGGR